MGCFVVFPVFSWIGLYMMFLTGNADSEREDSVWSLVYSKTTVLMLLGPIKIEDVKAVPVGSDVPLTAVDAAL